MINIPLGVDFRCPNIHIHYLKMACDMLNTLKRLSKMMWCASIRNIGNGISISMEWKMPNRTQHVFLPTLHQHLEPKEETCVASFVCSIIYFSSLNSLFRRFRCAAHKTSSVFRSFNSRVHIPVYHPFVSFNLTQNGIEFLIQIQFEKM